MFQTKIDLTSLVDGGASNNVWVHQAHVERSQVRVVIGNGDEYGAIDGWVTLIGLQVRLSSVATATALAGAVAAASAITVASAIAVRDAQRAVCHVKLRDPGNILRGLCLGGGDIAVVGTDFFARALPLQSHLATREREGSSNSRYIGAAVAAGVGVGA